MKYQLSTQEQIFQYVCILLSLGFVWNWSNLSLSFRVSSLATGQAYAVSQWQWPILKNVGKWFREIHQELPYNPNTTGHNETLYTWWRHQMETFSALLALCAGNSPVPVNSPHKGQWRGALMFTLICAGINDWVNNREAGDLRRHLDHYDVSVMMSHGITYVVYGPILLTWANFNPSM